MELRAFRRWIVLLVLALGIYLRWAALEPMSSMSHYDEAWNWGDAAEIIAEPHFTPFFPGNFGREAGWVYWLALFGSILGTSIFTIRFAATVTGILTLAAAYRLGCELFNQQVALWVLAILSVFYWHVHLSQLALRANLFVLVGTLTFGWLLIAYRTNHAAWWLLGGLGFGLLAYTYFASFFWILLTGMLLLGIVFTDRQRRLGALLTLCMAFLLALPMGLYFLDNPSLLLNRPTAVSTFSSGEILTNLNKWRLAWFTQGDTNLAFNLPGRPILGPIGGSLGAVGLGSLIWLKQYRRKAALIIGYAIVAILPSLFSTFSPHFLRASGLIIPTAVVLGIGLWGVMLLAQRVLRFQGPIIFLLPLLTIGYLAIQTYQDFQNKWLLHPEIFSLMEQHIGQSLAFLRDDESSTTPVYFTPFQSGHPVVRFAESQLGGRPVASFVSDQCLVLPDSEATYVSLTMYEPNFANALGKFATVEPLLTDTSNAADPRFTVFSAQINKNMLVSSPVHFGELLEVTLLSTLPTTFFPNQTIPITLGITPLQQIDMVPSLFVHLYDVADTAVQTLITQADSQLCASYPAHLWRTDETIVQTFTLTLPPQMSSSIYQIALGIYHFPDGARLPISQPANTDATNNAFVLHKFRTAE